MRLIAFDMDGTLLNSQKQITPRTLEAIARADAAGKIIALSTGRCLAELADYMPVLTKVRYLCCVSGGYVYDAAERSFISNDPIPAETVREIIKITRLEDCMVQLMNADSIVRCADVENMHLYGMGSYRDMFRRVTVMKDDVRRYFLEETPAVNKICVYHRDPACRERTIERLKSLDIEVARSETTSAECSPKGITKATGLCRLSEKLDIPMSRIIAVGDADNDVEALKAAGLAVAMGNAKDSVKQICGATVADNDHDGCAEAIDRFLLDDGLQL